MGEGGPLFDERRSRSNFRPTAVFIRVEHFSHMPSVIAGFYEYHKLSHSKCRREP